MNEYQHGLYDQALAAIEQEDLSEEDREELRTFTRGLDDPGLSAEFDLNMLFFWRLLGEARTRRLEDRQAYKEWCQGYHRHKGGVVKAKRRALADPNAWMKPIFDKAWAELDAECAKKHIGCVVLLKKAKQQAWEHPRRAELTDHHAKAYLQARVGGPPNC